MPLTRGAGPERQPDPETTELNVTNRPSPRPDIVLFNEFSAQGGVQRRLANMIKVWARQGYRIALVTYRDGAFFYPDEIGPLVTFERLGSRSKWGITLRLWRFLRRTRPRVILGTSHLANTILARLSFLPATGVRRLGNVPNTFGASQRKAGRHKARKLAAVRRFYRKLDGIIAVSRGVREDLLESVGLRSVPVHAIPNATISPVLFEKAGQAVDHPWLQPGREEPVVLSVGRLAPQKDQATLLEAVARARESRPCRLIILGEGPLRPELEARARELGIADSVALPGFVENPYAWMARSDCFALSSRWEGCPNVLIEAIALGIPAVATDCPSGPDEILQGGRFGHLVPMGDGPALAEAIADVLANGGPAFHREAATAEYTDETAAHRYLEAFGLAPREGAPGPDNGPAQNS